MNASSPWDIPFNRPHRTGNELRYLRQTIESGNLTGDGTFTRRCQDWLKAEHGFDPGPPHELVHRGARDVRVASRDLSWR